MERPCKVCKNPRRVEIDQALAVPGVSLRKLAGQFGTTKSTLSRHQLNCIPRAIQALQVGRDTLHLGQENPDEVGLVSHDRLAADAFREAIRQDAGAQVSALVSVERAVGRCFEVVNLLLDACDRDLRDPDDPTAYSLKLRATEIEIEWEERQAGTDKGTEVWVKKSGTLQQALDLVFTKDRRLVRTKPVSERDRAKLLLETVDRLMVGANFLAKLEGRFSEVNKEMGEGNTMTLDTLIQIIVQGGININLTG